MIQPFEVNGTTLFVDPSDAAVGWAHSLRRPPEPHVDRHLLPLFGHGKVFLDIGANIGFYSLRAARAGCRVIAIEPNPIALECLWAGIEANHLEYFRQIELFPCAVGANRGVAILNSNCTNAEVDTGGKLGLNGKVVGVDTVESITHRCRVVPDVIKIDIEGSEPWAVEGFGEYLLYRHPIVFSEFYPHLIQRMGGDADAYLDAWFSQQYQVSVLDKQTCERIPCKNRGEVMAQFNREVEIHGPEIAYLDLMMT